MSWRYDLSDNKRQQLIEKSAYFKQVKEDCEENHQHHLADDYDSMIRIIDDLLYNIY